MNTQPTPVPTPRVDAASIYRFDTTGGSGLCRDEYIIPDSGMFVVPADFARTLERELAEAKAHHQRDEALLVQRTNEIRHLEERLKDASTRGAQVALEAYKRDLADIKAERDTLRAEAERSKPAATYRNVRRLEQERDNAANDATKQAAEVAQLRARVAELEAQGAAQAFVDMSVRASEAERQVAELEADKALRKDLEDYLRGYVDLLVAELNDVVPLATAHGWTTTRADAGKIARELIDETTRKIDADREKGAT